MINADREFKEGKNQNSLRAEDIEKIAQVYRTRQNFDKYSRVVSSDELEKEEWNLNIRRYVDNSPPPEPHDVRAHLHGGIPVAEIEQLGDFFKNDEGVKDAIFVGWTFLSDTPASHATTTSKTKRSDGQECPSHAAFSPTITSKDQIKTTIESAPGLQTKHAAFQKAIAGWWKKNLAEIEPLPETKNVFELRRHCIDSLAKTLTSQGILTGHQVRGSALRYIAIPAVPANRIATYRQADACRSPMHRQGPRQSTPRRSLPPSSDDHHQKVPHIAIGPPCGSPAWSRDSFDHCVTAISGKKPNWPV